MTTPRLSWALPFFLCALSCSDNDFKLYSELKDLRVLALVADKPEINSPQTVNVSPYVSYAAGGDTDLEVSYTGCIDPGISFGEELDCSPGESIGFTQGTSTFSTNSLSSSNYSGFIPSIALNISATAFAFVQSQSPVRQYGGVDYLIILSVTDQNNAKQTVRSFKRVSLTTRTENLNANPTITGAIQEDGQTLSAFPSKEVDLKLTGLSAAESYIVQNAEGEFPVEEVMTVSWFSDVGEFSSAKSAPERTVNFDPKGETKGFFVAIYRDNRGGVAVVDLVLP